MEIVVTSAASSKTNTWVYEHDGALRSGWPQLNNESGYAWGVFNDNAAVGDLDGDGLGEIEMYTMFVPTRLMAYRFRLIPSIQVRVGVESAFGRT